MSQKFKIIDLRKDFNLLRQHLGINLSSEEKVMKAEQEREARLGCSDMAADFMGSAWHLFNTKILRRSPIDMYRDPPRYRLEK